MDNFVYVKMNNINGVPKLPHIHIFFFPTYHHSPTFRVGFLSYIVPCLSGNKAAEYCVISFQLCTYLIIQLILGGGAFRHNNWF